MFSFFVEVPIVSALFAILLTVLTCLAIFIADLRDPFQGNYRLGRGRMQRTLALLGDVTEIFKREASTASKRKLGGFLGDRVSRGFSEPG